MSFFFRFGSLSSKLFTRHRIIAWSACALSLVDRHAFWSFLTQPAQSVRVNAAYLWPCSTGSALCVGLALCLAIFESTWLLLGDKLFVSQKNFHAFGSDWALEFEVKWLIRTDFLITRKWLMNLISISAFLRLVLQITLFNFHKNAFSFGPNVTSRTVFALTCVPMLIRCETLAPKKVVKKMSPLRVSQVNHHFASAPSLPSAQMVAVHYFCLLKWLLARSLDWASFYFHAMASLARNDAPSQLTTSELDTCPFIIFGRFLSSDHYLGLTEWNQFWTQLVFG